MTPSLYTPEAAQYAGYAAYPAALNDRLPNGMRVQTLEVDNNTTQSLYLPDIQRYVPPLTSGFRVRVNGVTQLRAYVASPPGVTQTAATAGQDYVVTAHSDLLDPSPGSQYGIAIITIAPLASVAATIADGADVAEGALANAAVLDANGTVNGHVRGIVQTLANEINGAGLAGAHSPGVGVFTASIVFAAAGAGLRNKLEHLSFGIYNDGTGAGAAESYTVTVVDDATVVFSETFTNTGLANAAVSFARDVRISNAIANKALTVHFTAPSTLHVGQFVNASGAIVV